MKPLGELGSLFTDGDWIETKDQSPEGIRLVQTGNIGVGVFKDRREKARWISEETFDRLKCEEIFEGDILVSRLPDPVGRACLIPSVPDRCITGVDCAIIRLTHPITAQFVMRFCNSTGYFKEVESLATGATRKRISRKNLGTIEVPFPPLEEQERIVEVLDEAFAAIDRAKTNIERNLTNARELFQSRLNDIFSNPSEDWEVSPLGGVCEIQNGFAFKSKEYVESGARVIRIGNVQKGEIGDKSPRFMPTSRIEEFERFQIHEADILISLTGDVGRVGRFPEELLPALLNQRVGRFQGVDEARVNLDFLFQLLNSDWFEKQVVASAEGAAQMNSSTKKIKAIEIPLPPLSAQMKLAEELGVFESLVRTLERQCESQLESLEELRQSILEQAFEGKLTEPVAA